MTTAFEKITRLLILGKPMTVAEIADHLSMPRGTVSSVLYSNQGGVFKKTGDTPGDTAGATGSGSGTGSSGSSGSGSTGEPVEPYGDCGSMGECPGDEICVTQEPYQGCAQPCTAAAECPWSPSPANLAACVPMGGVDVCVLACEQSLQNCAAGQHCAYHNGYDAFCLWE